MDKKIDTIAFTIGTRRFEGQINMCRNGKALGLVNCTSKPT